MSNNEGGMSCTQGCWGLAVISGIIAAALLLILGRLAPDPGDLRPDRAHDHSGALLQWLVCKPMARPGAGPLQKKSEKPVLTSKELAAAAAAKAREGAEPQPETPAAAAAQAAKAGVKPSKPLAGEEELATRKGTWKYDNGTAASAASTPAATPAPAASEPAETEAAAAPSKADAPEQLSAAREGGPDDLKMIKGVGPKLEQLLHSMGFFHFDQIASWKSKEVAWVDENLEGFKGRVSRDNWVEQAQTLSSGGSTEFSNRVKKGDVY